MTDGDQTVLQEGQSLTAGSAAGLVSRAAPGGCGWPSVFDKSLLCREVRAEYEEILKHKWIESEKAGHDIGLDHALIDWVVKHRSKWRKGRQRPQRFAEM
jgi:hypothetical protein